MTWKFVRMWPCSSMTEPEPPTVPPGSKKPRGRVVVLMETTPGEIARKTSMLFCSSVATEGSVMPATLAVAALLSSLLKAAVGCWRRAPQRSKQATPAAAKSADKSAMKRIWRAEIRYMALFPVDFINFPKRVFSNSDAARLPRRCAQGRKPRQRLTGLRRGRQFYYEVAPARVRRACERRVRHTRERAARRTRIHKSPSVLIQAVWRKSSSVAFMPIAERRISDCGLLRRGDGEMGRRGERSSVVKRLPSSSSPLLPV